MTYSARRSGASSPTSQSLPAACTLDAAEQVCEADLDTLGSLVDKSLVRYRDDRYGMLETIREYALEQLDAREKTDATARALAEHLLALPEGGSPTLGITKPVGRLFLFPTTQQAKLLLKLLATELENSRAAVHWALAADEPELAARLAMEAWWVAASGGGGVPSEQRQWVDDILRHQSLPHGSRRRSRVFRRRVPSRLADAPRPARQRRGWFPSQNAHPTVSLSPMSGIDDALSAALIGVAADLQLFDHDHRDRRSRDPLRNTNASTTSTATATASAPTASPSDPNASAPPGNNSASPPPRSSNGSASASAKAGSARADATSNPSHGPPNAS